jgi:hypothetical protein
MEHAFASSPVGQDTEQLELVDDGSAAGFFAPTPTSLIDALLGEYAARRAQVDQLADLVAGDLGNVVHYFIEGNAGDERLHRSVYVDRLFERTGAVHQLDAAYWSKALSLTDVYEYMPQKRRDDWNAQLKCPAGKKSRYDEAWESEPLPEFTAEAVKPTIAGLLAMRSQFFAEKVDGIFRALSGEHITNAPEAFGKRMILACVFSYGYVEHGKAGYIHDLRCVIAKFMGRDEPTRNTTQHLMRSMEACTGQWTSVDGGALRIRCYKKGTAHLEVHPDMAWRLNCVLAQLHPLSIPAAFWQRPRKACKEVAPLIRPLPFRVLDIFAALEFGRCGGDVNTLTLAHVDCKSPEFAEAVQVLLSIGAVADRVLPHRFHFDYDAAPVLREIVINGCIPDRVSHQFYPTPPRLAEQVVALAEIGDDDRVLEPSAGQGDLAVYLPAQRTTCVEVAGLHCAVLKARAVGEVVQADFLEWAVAESQRGRRFERVVMNPPFADGRALRHLDAAATLVADGGILVAVLPGSLRGRTLLPGFDLEWSPSITGEFVDTAVTVTLLKAVRSWNAG